MQTANNTFAGFLETHNPFILQLCYQEGFTFLVRKSSRCITVRCTLPDQSIRFVTFDDHRTENPHGGKAHICNQWYKGIGDPLSFTIGKPVKNKDEVQKVLLAVAVMCMTQSTGYNTIKEGLFV